ncbi:MAG: DNA repair protein RecN [Bacteroidetes bacterium]|nr:DNA repair protein RecN [Bacteroidota bacterium]
MLKRLYINNFALINEMDVSFPSDLTVITGETGAGKSIFLEALGLVLGNRADVSVLQSKAKKCIIEAEFDINKINLKSFFNENELDEDETLILRREINAEGKSRNFLNDSPVSLNALKQLSSFLIDIHSQHQTLLLNQTNFQIELLDVFAESTSDCNTYKKNYTQLKNWENEFETLQQQETQAKKEIDYLQFLFNELNNIEIKNGNLLKLETESKLLENAEFIKTNLTECYNQLSVNEHSIIQQLNSVKSILNTISKYNTVYADFNTRVNSVYIELKELVNELENAEEEIEYNPSKLAIINEQLDQLNRLLKKHNVKSEEELNKVKEEIETKLKNFQSIESALSKLTNQIKTQEQICLQQATLISEKREKATRKIEQMVKTMLNDLSMPNAEFKIEVLKLNSLTKTGIDEVSFMFSANKGSKLNPLHKVASGGELSRLMLSLKALLATKKQLATIIFDEVDTGVSGDVANKMGLILESMSKNLQVITITHLPQMASKGNHHLFVYKKDDDEKTSSFIKELSPAERIAEIAKMLSSGNPSNAAIKNAKELLK